MANPNAPEPQPAPAAEHDPTEKMSFFDHLQELRTRIFYSVIAVAAGMTIGLYFSNQAFDFLARPMVQALEQAGLGDKLIYTSPLGPLRLLLTVGLYVGLVVASPFVLYQVWLFVAPGLYRHERRAALSFLTSSILLFLAGTAFGYLLLLPMTLRFLISFQGPFTPMISINDYFDLVLVILLGLGVMFQLPILIFFLALFGIVTPRFLWENFRYAVLLIAVVAALLTPTTDPLTMILFMGPMILLYVLGIGVAYLVARRRGNQAPVPARVRSVTTVVAFLGIVASAAAVWWAGRRFGWWSRLR